jgi:carbonic anhydrase/acetyltransferase-like protein (isoleucine patch superfamily)
VLIERNGQAPRVHASVRIAASATIVGNVLVGAGAHVDHAAVIAAFRWLEQA